jgi:hypothetical protein
MSIVVESDLAADSNIAQANDQPHTQNSCDICATLTSFFYDSYQEEMKVELGNIKDIIKSIYRHVALFDDLQPIWEDEEGQRWRIDEEQAVVGDEGLDSEDEDDRQSLIDFVKENATLSVHYFEKGSISFEATVSGLPGHSDLLARGFEDSN